MPRVHLIGVCGTAMATLAALMKHRGWTVSGSDEHVYPPMSGFLEAEGIATHEGYHPSRIDEGLDLVVVGNAVSRGNVELEAVLDRRVRYASLPETLRDHFLWDASPVVIAGTHGKTTTTSLAGWLLTDGGVDPTVLVGGIVRNFGQSGSSYRVGRGAPFVIEGDEYDSAYFDKTAKFLKYLPQVAVVNNIEFDHADIYRDLDEVRQAFRRFVNLVPSGGLTVLGIDSPDAAALAPLARSPVQTFGLSDTAEWRATAIAVENASTRFTVTRRGVEWGAFQMPLIGSHNLKNALAALVVGHHFGLSGEVMARGLASFRGVKRRLEVVGETRGITVLDDFAHHPTAVHETLTAIRAAYPGRRVWAVFEPRSASSCRRVFQDEFARAFAAADALVLASVFRGSLPDAERLSEVDLVAAVSAAGTHARHVPTVEAIVTLLAGECVEGDLVVIMSNGGFGGIHRRLMEAL